MTAILCRLFCISLFADGQVVRTVVSQGYECTVHDLKILGLNPGKVELVVSSTSV